ncbi:MAG: E3 binding domain-containing protein, partial [Rhodospirillaceae bacterium]|nr:E3 binding domain-containing protein [Rhodospirillaceae bacterium]
MPTTITMPALSPTMTEGTLARWLIKEGDSVSAGDVIAEIETDKAAMEIEAVDEGSVGRLLVVEGTEGVPVNQPIAVLLEDGEDASALDGFLPTDGAPAPASQAIPPEGSPTPATGRVFASPLAHRMAEKAGLDLAAIQGTGPRGRVVKSDIEAALSAGATRAAQGPRVSASPPPPPTARGEQSVPHTNIS